MQFFQFFLHLPMCVSRPHHSFPRSAPAFALPSAGPKASIACSEVASTWVRPRHPQRKVSWAARFQGLNQDKSAYVHVVTIVLRALSMLPHTNRSRIMSKAIARSLAIPHFFPRLLRLPAALAPIWCVARNNPPILFLFGNKTSKSPLPGWWSTPGFSCRTRGFWL